MSILSTGGYYDENGKWVQTKHCYIHCGNACNCRPPKEPPCLFDGLDTDKAYGIACNCPKCSPRC